MLDLKTELDREWPSLEVEENEEIWRKEWENHGICSQPLLTQHAFFETALKLKQTFDIFTILANRGLYCFKIWTKLWSSIWKIVHLSLVREMSLCLPIILVNSLQVLKIVVSCPYTSLLLILWRKMWWVKVPTILR